MKKKSASLWILILLIISSLTVPAEAAKKAWEDHLIYEKDEELWITNGKHEPVKLTEGLCNEDFRMNIEVSEILSYGKEGRVLLIPENINGVFKYTYTYDLYYVDLMDNTYPKKKIDERVLFHKAYDDSRVLYYEKLTENVIEGKNVQKVEIYRFDFGKKEKVAEGEIQDVSDDGKTLLFVDNNTLYKKTVGQEAIKIVDNLPSRNSYDIIKFDRSLDTVYYILEESAIYEKVNETLYKKVKNNPAEKVLENCGSYPFAENILDGTSYRNGTFYYFKNNSGEEEKERMYGEFVVDDITPQIYERMDKRDRENVDRLRRWMNFGVGKFFTDMELYFYDGETSHLVEEGELVYPLGNSLVSFFRHQGNRSIYSMLNKEPVPKVKLSEVIEKENKDREEAKTKRDRNLDDYEEKGWERGVSVEDVLHEMLRERLTRHHIFEDGRPVGVLKGGGVDLYFSKTPGELFFFRNVTDGSQKIGDLYSARLENNKLVSPRLLRRNIMVESLNIWLYEISLMQTKSMYIGENDEVYGGEGSNLYEDGRGIFNVGLTDDLEYNAAMDMMICYSTNPDFVPGTLQIYHDKKVTEIPKVDRGWRRIKFFNDRCIAFRKYKDVYQLPYQLVLFDGEKEQLIAENIDEFIVAGPSNYFERYDRPWVPID